jgi:O-methyltransferase involved in polyketide biosynthesis
MKPFQRSRTVEIPAIMRALHQTLDDDPKILTDPIAPHLIDLDDDLRWLAPLLEHPFAKQWRAGFTLRARYSEDCLMAAIRRGVRQYLVLGAGLDTFAYRQPSWASSVRIYEVDHPATQQWKRDRLPGASEIVFSFILPPDAVYGLEADALATATQSAAGAGEPWVTRLQPDALKARLHAMGFSRVIHFTPKEAHAQYFVHRRDGLKERHGEQLMRAVV